MTQSLEARQFYMRGRELWSTRDNVKMTEGIEFFRHAIALDPNFAAPYIGIADSLSMMRNDAEDWRQAAEYADAAIRLAPDSADAHATLGFIAALNKWNWRDAESYFKRALELDPNCGKAHQWYATLLLINRRFAEAEIHLKRAIEIEPMSPTFNGDLCELYVFAKRDDEAFSQCGKTNVINPDFRFANVTEVFIQQKRYDEAAQERIKLALQHGINEKTAKNAAWYKAFQKDGYRGWIQTEIDGNEKHKDVLLGEYNLSILYARLGDKEKTLNLLEKAFVGHTFLLPFANARPDFDFVRDEPRFQNLMRRIGLNQGEGNL
ncbi:MAG: tetratricopeptide repeat protein [Pyrinomonadaceae bacterium]|nr:tetratricopeptide repeat protein [Pyrinomonadaceae bacterium]